MVWSIIHGIFEVLISLGIIVCLFLLYTTLKKDKETKPELDSNQEPDLMSLLTSLEITYLEEVFDLTERDFQRLSADVNKPIILRKEITDLMLMRFDLFNMRFCDVLLVIDLELFKKVKNLMDDLQDNLINTALDESIDLTNWNDYKEYVLKPISVYKTEILKLVYSKRINQSHSYKI